MPGVLDLAAASGEDLAGVADIVTDSLTGFGLTAAGTGQFVDVLAAASTKSNTNVSLLGESFKYVAPLCGTLGYSAEDTAVSLGLMANAGIKGSQAGTTLRTSITNLVSPTKEQAAEMKRLGISLTDASGEMLPMLDMVGNLRTAFSGMSEAEQSAAASTIFGKEAMSGMLAVINASEADYQSLTQSIYNSAGAAERMANIKLDNLAGDLTLLQSATDGLSLSIGEQFMLQARGLVQAGNSPTSSSDFVRPAFILPKTLTIGDDGQLVFNTAPSTPGSITIPESVQGGTSVPVSWSASTDEQGNLEGYVVERSVNGGTSWTQIYQGSALSTANTVPFGTQSVMYRVKAYDSEGLSSGWRTSGAVTVVNNVAPSAPAGITLPEAVLGGQPLAIAWGAATDSDGNLSAYHLERSVDGGAWAEIYSGPDQNFTDSITKGWRTVAYRVRAADALGLFGDYTASPVREVDNNTAPVISCEHSGDLGEKNAGFEVSYSVSDEENDMVTVTEFLDGAVKRTFQAGTGTNSFAVTGEAFMKLSNGPHAMLIRASDGKIAATHELTFTKLVTAASVTLAEPMGASEAITLCALSVSGGIPADAAFKVEVTNNANDASPAWEDCTTAVRNRLNHIFENKTAANGFAFNFRLHVERGESGQGGYITSIQGGFQ